MEVEALAELLAVPDLPYLIERVDQRVRNALGTEENYLSEAAGRVAQAGGKRLRPVLTMAFAELGRSYDADAAVAGAAAVELVQIGSLVHDDMLDGATTRRAVPTINAVEGDTMALLAGDFILARAGEQATLVDETFAALLGRTMTWLCEGQLLELQDQFNAERPIERYMKSIRSKTAVLFAAACAAGAHASGMADEQIALAMEFGSEFGMAYQLVDDVFDFVADPARLGKPTGIDLDSGVYTLPVLLQIAKGDDSLVRLLEDRTPGGLDAAREAVLRAGGVEDALGVAARHSEAAASQMSAFSSAVAEGLSAFPRTYFGWAMEHFVPAAASS